MIEVSKTFSHLICAVEPKKIL